MPKPYRWVALCLAILFSTPLFSQEAEPAPAVDAAVITLGEDLFNTNCSACHQVHKKVIGPSLVGINDRQTEEWLIPWIQNSQKVIASGDQYAIDIYEEYGKMQMQAFSISDDDVRAILAYIDTVPEPVEETVAVVEGVDASNENGDSSYMTAVLVILVVVLVLILVVLGLIVSVLTKYLKEKEGLGEADQELVTQRMDVVGFLKSNAFIGLVVFLFTAVALKTLIDGAFSIGVQQGYQPTQPINYSHKIHAGDYEIDCNYCHTGVRKSRAANIPSPNICMNCHTDIKNVGGQDGISPEIEKIYAAVDYNPETREYGTNTKPIEWVRVHNLPDLSYFNHSQHVAIGEIECQTCHGPIQEMDVVYQYADLTMGWCINCHRETDINTKGNGYYDKLVELHNEKSKKPMTVEDNGGLECAKCHY